MADFQARNYRIFETSNLCALIFFLSVLRNSYGIWVRVQYSGEYLGTVGTVGKLREVSGTGDNLYQIPAASTDIVEISIQKLNSAGLPMTVELYNNGQLIKRGTTTAPGTVEMYTVVPTICPTRTPEPIRTPSIGNVIVTSSPVAATIYFDNLIKGITPLTMDNMVLSKNPVITPFFHDDTKLKKKVSMIIIRNRFFYRDPSPRVKLSSTDNVVIKNKLIIVN